MSIGRVPGATGIQPSIVDAKGDLIVATAADSVDRLAVGSTNQVLTVDSSTATGLKWAALPASGKVLQVVQGSTSTPVSNSTNVYADTGLSASITPSSTSSKILVLVTHNNNYKSAGNANNVMRLRLFRGATAIDTITTVNWNGTANEQTISSVTFNYLDSPSTTSSTTYKTQFMNQNNTASVSVHYDQGGAWPGTSSYITLIEIGA